MGDVEELLDRARPPGAVLAKQRLEDRVVARQCGRVRGNCGGTERGPPHLHDHDRLGRSPCRFQCMPELVAIPASLQVSHDDLRGRIARHPCDAIGDADVRLVAGGHPHGESDAAFARHRVGIGPERAALADNADLAGLRQPGRHHRRECRVDRPGDVHEAEAVGPQHPDAGRARALGELALAPFHPPRPFRRNQRRTSRCFSPPPPSHHRAQPRRRRQGLRRWRDRSPGAPRAAKRMRDDPRSPRPWR